MQDRESSSEEDSDEEEEEQPQQRAAPAARPAASSFAPKTGGISADLKQVDLNARRNTEPSAEINEDEFETDESEAGSGSEGSESEEEDSSEEEESSSEDEKPVRARPVFLRKGQRDAAAAAGGGTNGAEPPKKSEDEQWAEEQARKKEKADAMIQEELEKQAQAKAAGKKYWDDEDNIVDDVDDTDDIDPEAEYAAWKLRELKRLKRDKDAIVLAEREREEVERRRNLSKEEREAEDKVFLEAQKAAKEGKGTMGFKQKYFHKGAFYTEDLGELGKRDIMGGRYEDDFKMKEALPEYLQKRDITKIGKKGGTRYKDMRSEDTGPWGDFLDRRGPPRRDGDNFQSNDDRFRPDYDGGGGRDGPSGANASALGERKRPPPDQDRGEDKRARVS